MTIRRAAVLVFLLLVCWLAGILDLKFQVFSDIRILNDNYDREIYSRIGSWVADGKIPYRDAPSEYPQIATYLFALPNLALEVFLPPARIGYRLWICVFSFAMLALLLAEILLLTRMLPARKWLALLLLLPACLYFAYNRYDLLPALICLIAFLCLARERWLEAAVLLGIGTLTKWYPALLLPLFLAHAGRVRRRIPWDMALVFAAVCLAVAVPSLLAAGWTEFWRPYAFHIGRSVNPVSFPGLIETALARIPGFDPAAPRPAFLILQFAPALLLPLGRIDSLRRVLHGSILAVACFFLFSSLYSPQWILWLAPFLLLAVENRRDIAWFTAAGLVTYVAFPVFYDLYGIDHPVMAAMGAFQALFLIRTLIVSLRRISVRPDASAEPLRRFAAPAME